MAILPDIAAVIAALPLPKGFSVCELGDQAMAGKVKNRPAEPWYRSLGCGRYESIDGNGRGTITADLNLPLKTSHSLQGMLFQSFNLVTDIGTGEHIFDQAQVWRTIHDLVKVGGYIVVDRPAQGYAKHCFYLTNETLFRDIAAANRYELPFLDRKATERGELIRGVFRRTTEAHFVVPQQGKYKPDLVIT